MVIFFEQIITNSIITEIVKKKSRNYNQSGYLYQVMLITGVTKRKLRNLGYKNTFGLETSLLLGAK